MRINCEAPFLKHVRILILFPKQMMTRRISFGSGLEKMGVAEGEMPESSDGFGQGPSPKARRPEAIFLSPARPEPDFLKAYS